MGAVPFDPRNDPGRLDWFHLPPTAVPICPEGPGADPASGLRAWDTDEQELETAAGEQERLGRFTAWLQARELAETERREDQENARRWTDFLGRCLPAGAVTEHDLRLFIYGYFADRKQLSVQAERALPRSLRRIVQWLQEQEGIRYPFAPAVLDELAELESRGRALGEPLEGTLAAMREDLEDYLNLRAMLPSDELPGVPDGRWPEFMGGDVPYLREELRRRWLLWYDELVRGGTTDFNELKDVLVDRQRAWELTPHPRVGGRTPRQVIEDYVQPNS